MKNLVPVRLLALEGVPILQQLQLEEALLRAGNANYCLINHQSPPAIVMGISGKVDLLIDIDKYQMKPVPVIRRFSGGGCVLVGHETLFLTFIFNRTDVDIGSCPRRLLTWTEEVLRPAFCHTNFHVKENDYCIGDKKFGGNAQYFTKNRWLHHSSLIWDYCSEEMRVLKLPPKMPEYRAGRGHDMFLTCLRHHVESKDTFLKKLVEVMKEQFEVVEQTEDEVRHVLLEPHRKATSLEVIELIDKIKNNKDNQDDQDRTKRVM